MTGAVLLPPRRIWIVVVALAAYCGLLVATDAPNLVNRVLGVGYLGFIGIVIGMAARHFLRVHLEALRRQVELLRTRQQAETEERNSVARDLHDLVAY